VGKGGIFLIDLYNKTLTSNAQTCKLRGGEKSDMSTNDTVDFWGQRN